MRNLKNLEIHLVHACNFTCESCSHYSNHQHQGILSLEEADGWMKQWNHRISPTAFSLLGGEPTLHPNLAEFVILARQNWPEAYLRIVTNGWFLHRHPQLPIVLQNDPKAFLELSIHHHASEYKEKLKPILKLLRSWVQEYGIQVSHSWSSKHWTRRYKGYGATMEPFEDSEPRASWEKCPAKYCPQLLEGKIWKCGPLAYLKMQDSKYNLSDNWKPYLQYQPLQPDCTDEELNEFFDREEETYCGMCPANPQVFELPLPFRSKSNAAKAIATL